MGLHFEEERAKDEQAGDTKKSRRWGLKNWGRKNWGWKSWVGIAAVVVVIAGLITVEWVAHHVEPILRARVVKTLEAQFQCRVALAGFQVSVLDGLNVEGSGLKIFPRGEPGATPLFAIDRFSFHTRWMDLFRSPMRVQVAHIRDFTMNIPPKDKRWQLPKLKGKQKKQSQSIVVNELEVQQATLTMEKDKPGKVPLVFQISKLNMQRVGPHQPMRFEARLVNPKPLGDIQTTGTFGPFVEGSVGDSPVKGRYSFNHVDLSTIKGIGGTLSSTGQFSGQLNQIVVDGETKTPDFQISTANHAVPLTTEFHAIVDGTNGNTYLQPVHAVLGSSHILASGEVVREEDGHGHEVNLKVTVAQAQIQDFLALAVKGEPPLMSGAVKMHVLFHLPPGNVAVMNKLQLKGEFSIADARFSNRKIQTDVDRLSLRARGKPNKAKALHKQQKAGGAMDSPKVASQIRGHFVLGGGQLQLSHLIYRLPGAMIGLAGTYALDGKSMDLHGQVRTKATLSQMTTGWKSFALKAVDPFLEQKGAGMQVPFKITGSQAKPQIGLDFKHKRQDHRIAKPLQPEKPVGRVHK